MDFIEISDKTIEDAITKASIELGTTSDKLEYEVIEKGSTGVLGFGRKPAVIRARKKNVVKDTVMEFLNNVFRTMEMQVEIVMEYDETSGNMDIELKGENMGILIGKRGQTLDSLQYLISLVANRESEERIHVKLDTENYRRRRRETLENLARNISFKVRKTKKPVFLEPMNPYERRVIHSALQNDRYVETHSEGDEPYRKVVVTLRRNY
ncbi:MAG: protein jag [Lachnospiraceae bacterium]|nr:protein jag [Lachnospiraceae bacterium]